MIAVALGLAALAAWGVVATIVAVRRDGHRRVPTRPAVERGHTERR